MKKQILCAIIVAAFAVGCSSTGEKGGTSEKQSVLNSGNVSGIGVKELPQPVKDTLQQQVPAAQISSIDKETMNGKTIYKINFTDPAKFPTMSIAEDGSQIQQPTK